MRTVRLLLFAGTTLVGPFCGRVFPAAALLPAPQRSAVTALAGGAGCDDPRPPAGGFAVREDLDQAIRYRDGTQSRIDVRYPAAAPGPCGWPVVLFVHDFAGSRRLIAPDLIGLAQEGYLVASWEARGQGEWNALNPATVGTQFVGRDDRLDVVEVVEWLRATYGGATPRGDVGRLAFASRGPSGASYQGSALAWAAAAWSGKLLPANPRGLARFPTFRAVTAALFPPLTAGAMVPAGRGINPGALAQVFLVPALRIDPALAAVLRPRMLAEDFAGTAAVLDGDPFRQELAELRTSDVPVLAGAAWNDAWGPPARTLEALAALPGSSPRRLVLGVFGAGAPYNDREAELFLGLQRRWLERFLKRVDNGVEREAGFLAGAVPADAAAYLDPSTLLWTRHHDAWPPPATQPRRWFLRQGGALSPSAPSGAEPSDLVDHRVRAGFDMAAYVTQAFTDVAETLRAIPLSSVAYDSAPLAADAEVAGAARVTLEVTPTGRNYQVHCALMRLAPGGEERFLSSGYALVRAGAVTPATLDVVLRDVDTVLTAGDRIRLRVENLAYQRPPGQQSLAVAPYFETTSYRVEHGAARPSWLDLPLRTVVQPALSTALHDISTANPVNLRYTLAAPAALAGSPYVTLFGASGTASALPLPGSDPLRLDLDAVTQLMLSVGPPFLFRNPGVLDPFGREYPSFELRGLHVVASLRGLRLSAAALVVAGAGVLATNPVDVFFR
jgi:predicted acyl esterase